METGNIYYRRFLDGDKDAIDVIIEQYYQQIAAYISVYIKDGDMAEEIAEDTFFVLMTKKPWFSGKSSFKTFLFSIAKNRAKSYLRMQKTEAGALRNTAIVSEFISSSAEEDYIRQKEQTELYRAISKLSDGYRQVLWLYYFEDMTAKEIAGVVRKPLKSVNNLLFRAREALKNQLEKDGASICGILKK